MVRAEVERILAWEPFQRSDRLSRFLRYTVEQVLESSAPQLKEYVIALEVFDKPKDFDPRLDPIVRVEARRLRYRIREYYESKGRDNPVRIRYAPRGYKPVFESASGQPEREPVEASCESGAPGPEAASLAVLPFVDLSPEYSSQNLCESLTEEVINALGRLGALRVASRTSTRRFGGKSFDIRKAGRDLGVDAILEGSIRHNAQRTRIAAQLYSVSDGLELWSRAYERTNVDSFSVVTEVAATIAESLNIRLANGRHAPEVVRPETQRPPANARAYRMYLRGIQHWRDYDDPGGAVASLERSIAEEPDFAAAHGGLALAYAILAWYKEARPGDAWPKAEAAASAGLHLDPFLTEGHTVLGCYRALFQWDWQAAERTFLRAVELGPDESVAYEWYARACLVPTLRWEEAVQAIERAQALEPLAPMVQSHAGIIRFYRGELDRARELFQSALEIQPEFWPALWNLSRVLLEEEDFERAEEALIRTRNAAQGSLAGAGHLGYCYARRGKRDRAEQVASELVERSRSRYVSPLQLARVHIGLGQYGEALDAIQEARKYRCARMAELAADPIYKPLRSDARFTEITRAIGLPCQ